MGVRLITSNHGGAIVVEFSLILKVVAIIGSEIAIEREWEKGRYTSTLMLKQASKTQTHFNSSQLHPSNQ